MEEIAAEFLQAFSDLYEPIAYATRAYRYAIKLAHGRRRHANGKGSAQQWQQSVGVLGRRLSGKKSARGADLGTSQSLLRVEHYGLRDRQMAVIESCSEVED
jgi:hypothetical protein